jgi:D-xylose transport system permease protein
LTIELSEDRSAEGHPSAEPRSQLAWRAIVAHSRSLGGLLLAIAIVWAIFFVVTDGIFLSDRNVINLFRQSSITAVVALGMLIVIAQGEIDLSVGSLLGLCATVVAMMETAGTFSPIVSVLIALLIGLAVGLWNGAWVAMLGVPAFVATLGGMLAFRGLSLALSGGRTISGIRPQIRFIGEAFLTGPALWVFLLVALGLALYPLRRISGSAQSRKSITTVVLGVSAVALLAWATLSYRGLPMPVAIALGVAALLAGLLSNTVWGRHVFAVGGNRSAAKLSGIRVGRHIVTGYVLIGVLTAIASLIFVGRLAAAPPEAGYFLELNAISAVVIGGASLYGGTGTVPGVLLGAILMQSLSNGLSLMNVPTAYQNMTSGLVLILAVYLDAVSKRGGKAFLRS